MPDNLILVSCEQMRNRVRLETRLLYAKKVTYPDCAGFTEAGISSLPREQAGPLRVAVTSKQNAYGRAFHEFIALMYLRLPMNEEEFLAYALQAPAPFRMVADLLSEGTLPILRHYARAMGEPIDTRYCDHGLFAQVGDHYRPLIGLFFHDHSGPFMEGRECCHEKLFWLIKAKRSRFKGDLELLDNEFHECTWTGPRVKREVEHFMSLGLPIIGADVVDIVRPTLVYLWGKLPVRLEDLAWWVWRNRPMTISPNSRPNSLAERRRRKEGRRFRRHARRRELRRRNNTAPETLPSKPRRLNRKQVVKQGLDAASGDAKVFPGQDLMKSAMDVLGLSRIRQAEVLDCFRRLWTPKLDNANEVDNAEEQGAVGGTNIVAGDFKPTD